LTGCHAQTAEYFRNLTKTCPGQVNAEYDGENRI